MLGGAPHHGELGAVIEGADTFDVVVTGFEPGDETPTQRLQRVFGIGAEAAERVVARLPAPVQRGVPRIRAEYFRRALMKIGAHVEVRSPEGLAVEAVPSVPPPAPRRPSDRPGQLAPPPRSAPPVEPPASFAAPAVLAPLPPAPATPPAAPLPAPRSHSLRAAAAPTAIAAPALASAPAAPVPASQPARPRPMQREPRLLLDDDDDLPLADSLRPEALRPPAASPLLSLDLPGGPVALGDAPAASFGAALLGAAGTADTMVDARPRNQPVPPESNVASAKGALGAPALDHDTLADAVRMPANITLSEGLKPRTAPAAGLQGAPSPRSGATATVLHGKAMVPAAQPPSPGGPAPSASAEPPLLFDSGLPIPPAGHGFRPPALELGLDGANVMTKLPSSIWDAPPSASQEPAPPPAAKRIAASGDLDLPGASAARLDLGAPAEIPEIDAPLDLPSMPAPVRGGRAPLPQPKSPQSARDRPPREPRARVGKVGAAKTSKKRDAPAEPVREPVLFWPGITAVLSLPFTGTGAAWIGLIVLWAFAAALLTAASMLVVALGVIVAFCAYTTLLALACDYFRACFWLAEQGSSALDRAPSLAPARIFHNYLKSGAHLTVIALAAGLPLIVVAIDGVGDGATPLELLGEPGTWLLALIPALLWPGVVAMTALHNRYEAIWQLPRALATAARAPLEYLAVVAAGALIFGAGVYVLLALASAAGISGVLLSAVLGPPMALSHGVQGALMGLLMRARPELFK